MSQGTEKEAEICSATVPLSYSAPFQSFLDTSFFQELSRLKLDVLKLGSEEVPLFSSLALKNVSKSNECAHLFLNEQSFRVPMDGGKNEEELEYKKEGTIDIPIQGSITNFNTFEKFKSLNKQEFLNEKALELLKSGEKNINECIKFYIISFADLKKYKYYYWVCSPSFKPIDLDIKILKSQETVTNVEKYQTWFKSHKTEWIGLIDHDSTEVASYSKAIAKTAKIIILRDTSNLKGTPSSLLQNLFTIYMNDQDDHIREIEVFFIRPSKESSFKETFRLQLEGKSKTDYALSLTSNLKVSGWERNMQGKLMPRAVDLSELIDPMKVADQSVDLNLKLMKWRIIPDIDLDIIKKQQVLLLGAGTLGCYIARALMAWGVRNITLVDNSTVSYSNPVRQSLFEFADFGKPKAEAAAATMKRVFPLVNAKGVNLNVPMIGHPINNEEREKKEFYQLRELIRSHDAVFLLMDSRETRWLPTVLCNIEGKIVINAALGFDSYLVMRHGNYHGDDGVAVKEDDERLGCYFCHDVVAPTDSLSDRTLDEMCTVTRPGVAMMAASQSVELFVSLLQHSGFTNAKTNQETILGEIPHQIRGFLNRFTTLKLETPAYKYCSACSVAVIEECKKDDWEFVKKALNNRDYVEKLSGLYQMKQNIDIMDQELFEWEDDMTGEASIE
ncbi:Atg7p NDAI_0C03390 [Naumovozyma dairenensis CBS 421]|uniref:Ubiquitin-like modifier-activating enzyme ATG7 n=1 Tax=Naumovozyma dairenensis (strain ATCC 10597 / BCRC 20456 / CBS 421 / NBRC 0211 / NRRL Y-12639) TaxID=1071378 RepID=G0W888_NAUDC|nr:hypothetical protein NDAI_0C03390 [Naumovozyma dairenensis CBS 421]CCD23999.1 hypothetical protein NDAI_0C03390 [Naumovozyma dairenensis CBS 421]